VHRMSVSGGTTTSCSPSSVSDADARRLARFTNPQTAEGFFARTVILVEGVSDKLALEAAAELSGVSLDGKGVSIVSVDGGNTLRMYLRLFGGEGFGLDLVGMCDEDKEGVWQRDLSDAGYGDVPDRAAMEHLHFYVACQDLEDELVRALGDQETEECIREQGDSTKLSKFSGQPKQAGKSRHDQLRAFLQVRDRKARYAPLLVDRLTEAALPDVLRKVLSNV